MYTEIILHIAGVLRLNHCTYIQTPFCSVHSEHELYLLSVVLILGVAAKALVEVIVERLWQQRQVVVPRTVSRGDAAECS